MTPETAFWDASAIVPLCVREPRTANALSLHRKYEIAVWWGTSVEIAGAISRLRRMRLLGPADWRSAQHTAATFMQVWTVVLPSDSLRARAQQIVETYELRAGDAFQLAAALAWCNDVPRGRKLLTADDRLFQAALLSGFDVVNL